MVESEDDDVSRLNTVLVSNIGWRITLTMPKICTDQERRSFPENFVARGLEGRRSDWSEEKTEEE